VMVYSSSRCLSEQHPIRADFTPSAHLVFTTSNTSLRRSFHLGLVILLIVSTLRSRRRVPVRSFSAMQIETLLIFRGRPIEWVI
jgi:hypothetical protein